MPGIAAVLVTIRKGIVYSLMFLQFRAIFQATKVDWTMGFRYTSLLGLEERLEEEARSNGTW